MCSRRGLAARIMCLVGVLLAMSSCASETTRLRTGDELARSLQEAGWLPVDLPRELLGPGTIISLSLAEGPRYRGRVQSCVDPATVQLSIGAAALPNNTKTVNLSVSALAKFQKLIRLKPTIQNVKTITWTIGKVEEVVLDEILLTREVMKKAKDFDAACLGYFQASNTYIITEALRIFDYTLTLKDQSGAALALTLDKVTQYLEIGGEVSYRTTDDGSIHVGNVPMYIAFRGAKFVTLDAIPQGTPAEDATILMNRYYDAHPVRW